MLSITPVKIWTLGILTLVLLIVLAGFYDPLSAWHWQQVPLHSTVETLGGIVAILISVVLFWESQKKMDTHLIMVAAGFASMGVLDTAHAMSPYGEAFIFLHSVASLSGGFFFATIWFTHGRRIKGRVEQLFIYFGAMFLSVTVGFRALLFPGDVPRILPLFDKQFTVAAVLINMMASLFFLAAVPKFYKMYRQERHLHDLLFAYLACLFGVAEMVFKFSSPWNGIWWSWHLIRLCAFLTILLFLVQRYRKRMGFGGIDFQGEGRRGQ